MRAANRLDEARALRAWLEAGGTRLAADLQDPPDFARLSEIGRAAPAALQAVLCDVGLSRAHVGRYLLDAGRNYEAAGQYDEAREAYELIRERFEESSQASGIDFYLARLDALSKAGS